MFWLILIWMIYGSIEKILIGDYIPLIITIVFIAFYYYIWKLDEQDKEQESQRIGISQGSTKEAQESEQKFEEKK